MVPKARIGTRKIMVRTIGKNKHEICRRKLMDSAYWDLNPFGKPKWSEDSNQFIVCTKDNGKKWIANLND